MNAYDYEVDQLNQEQWHAILPLFKDALFEQTWSYGAFRWRNAKLSHLIVKHNQTIVAAAQVAIVTFPVVKTGIAFIKFGPLWQRFDEPAELENLKQALAFLRQEYVVNRGLFLRIMPSVSYLDPKQISRHIISAGFTQKSINNPNRYLVNLSDSIEDIRKSLKPRWRSKLKKAEKRNLTVVQLDDDEAIKLFMPLYEKMLKRKAFDDSSAIMELPEIFNDLPAELKPKGWFCMHKEQCIAAVIISSIGDTALYLFGATDDLGLDVGAGFFLQWCVIKWLREQGVKWYDLGGDCGDAGLRQFKSGLIGKQGVITPLPGDFDQCINVATRVLTKLAFSLRALSIFLRSYLNKINIISRYS